MARWWCQECGNNDEWAPLELKDGVCRECRETLARHEANVHNAQAWADTHGRRDVAGKLVHEAGKYLSPRERERFAGRVLAWEMSGSARDLRWLVNRLSEYWDQEKRVVPSPDAVVSQQETEPRS